MKSLLLLLLLLVAGSTSQTFAQGHKFSYSPDGYRVKREYIPSLVYKPGRDDTQQADTIIAYKNDGSTPLDLKNDQLLVRAYPNPVIDVLFVENLSWQENDKAMFKILDQAGKEIFTKQTTLPKDNFTMSHLPAGTYNVSYYLNGAFVISWQMVKI